MGNVRITIECTNLDKSSYESISMDVPIVNDIRYMNDITSTIKSEIIKVIYNCCRLE